MIERYNRRTAKSKAATQAGPESASALVASLTVALPETQRLVRAATAEAKVGAAETDQTGEIGRAHV